MRFLFCAGGGVDNRVEAGYELSVSCTGKSLGIIGTGISAICPSSMLVTSNGTLLVATGYGPMLRMRQNETTLTAAGVPAPSQIPIITPETQFAPDPQPDKLTLHFDYSQYGSLARIANQATHSLKWTPEGEASQKKRSEDEQKYSGLLGWAGKFPLTSQAPDPPVSGEYFVSGQPLRQSIFTGMRQWRVGVSGVLSQINFRWNYQTFDIQVVNPTSPTSPFGTTTYSGRYQCFMRYVDKDGVYSDPTATSSDQVLNEAPYIYYQNVEVPTDPRVRRRQIFRNINGSSDVFYLDIDTDDITSDTLISRNTDAQLKLSFGQPVWDDNNYNLFTLYAEPPTDKPYIAEFNNRIFGAGFRIYSEGNVIVVNGSTTVTGVGTNFTRYFAGRRFSCGNQTYLINRVDESAQTFVIERAYEGSDNHYADYIIQPYYGNTKLLQWSESGLHESWGIFNALELPDDGDEVTGLVAFANSLWILEQSHIYQFNFTLDPNRDGDYKPVSNRGCVNQRCAVQIQSVCLMLDRTGIHVFRGMLPRNEYQVNSTPDHLSVPIGDVFRFEGSGLRINWDADKCFWHAAHNKELMTVRWHVTMQGYYLPQHAICYNYLMDVWWIEEYPFPITSSAESLSLPGKPILGGPGGKIYQPDRGPLDVIDPTDTRLSVLDCIAGVIVQVDGTVSDSAVGLRLSVVSGLGRGQESTIIAVDDDEVELDMPMAVWPDETSIVQIGAVRYSVTTGEYNYAKIEQINPQSVSLIFRNATLPLETYISILKDSLNYQSSAVVGKWGCVTSVPDDPNVFKADMTDESGCATVNMDGFRERDIPNRYCMQVTIEGFSGQEKPSINNIYIVGASQKTDLAV